MSSSPVIPDKTDTTTDKINLLGLTQAKLEQFFENLGEKRFRATQVMKWIHQLGVTDFEQMTNISKVLRTKMASVAEITYPNVLQRYDSSDGTRKFLIEVPGSNAIETVFIPDGERGTLCVSSQAGCSLDCSFCATGKQGFSRDLTVHEIVGQIWLAAKSLGQLEDGAKRRVTNVVFMGMGEPLLNFDPVMESVNIMMHDHCYGISKRRVTISTSGVVPAIERMGEYTDACLAISLHAPTDELRNQLVPINKKYPIARLLEASQNYIAGLPDVHRKLTIEYTLIDQVNDRPEHAHQLAELLRNVPVKINLIPFNPFDLSDYKKVSNNALRRFQTILIDAGFIATVRTTRGDDIEAACGQLAGQINDRTKRSARYLAGAERLTANEEQVIKILPKP